MPNRRRNLGLTLLELAIVLAVLTVLGALVAPSFSARLDRQRLQHTAQTLADDIAEARFEAARRGSTLHLQAETGAAWCWSVATAPDCPCGQAQSCQLKRAGTREHPNVRLLTPYRLRLEPGGAALAAAGQDTLTLESARGESLRVDVSALGRPRICALKGLWPRVPPCQ